MFDFLLKAPFTASIGFMDDSNRAGIIKEERLITKRTKIQNEMVVTFRHPAMSIGVLKIAEA